MYLGEFAKLKKEVQNTRLNKGLGIFAEHKYASALQVVAALGKSFVLGSKRTSRVSEILGS